MNPSLDTRPTTNPGIEQDRLLRFLRANGYRQLIDVPGEGLCGLQPYAFTWAVVAGLTIDGYNRRYCYENFSDAHEGLSQWGGGGHPKGPWIKCKGAGVDLLNPALSWK